jgi:hypothetical protein
VEAVESLLPAPLVGEMAAGGDVESPVLYEVRFSDECGEQVASP